MKIPFEAPRALCRSFTPDLHLYIHIIYIYNINIYIYIIYMIYMTSIKSLPAAGDALKGRADCCQQLADLRRRLRSAHLQRAGPAAPGPTAHGGDPGAGAGGHGPGGDAGGAHPGLKAGAEEGEGEGLR